MLNKITFPLVVATICLIVATVLQLRGIYPAAIYTLGLAIFNMVCHIGIRLEEKND